MLKINLTNLNTKKVNNITELLNVTKENNMFYLKDIIELKENKLTNLISNTFIFDINLSKTCTSFHTFKVLDVFNTLCLRKIDNTNKYKYLYAVVNSTNSIMHDLNQYYVYRDLFDFNNFAHLFIWLRLYYGIDYCNNDILTDVLNTIFENDIGKVISLLLLLYSYFTNIDLLDDVLRKLFSIHQYQYHFLSSFIRKQLEPYKHISIKVHENSDSIILHNDSNLTSDITSRTLLIIHDIIIAASKKQ